jgi:hypothetical protein
MISEMNGGIGDPDETSMSQLGKPDQAPFGKPGESYKVYYFRPFKDSLSVRVEVLGEDKVRVISTNRGRFLDEFYYHHGDIIKKPGDDELVDEGSWVRRADSTAAQSKRDTGFHF